MKIGELFDKIKESGINENQEIGTTGDDCLFMIQEASEYYEKQNIKRFKSAITRGMDYILEDELNEKVIDRYKKY